MAPLARRLPQVTVLLATYNGIRWIDQQLTSILDQAQVDVTVVALDDESVDGTYEWLRDRAAQDARITVLPRRGSSGSSAANFYRLISAIEPTPGVYYAFSDQDDVWEPGKLERHVGLLDSLHVDGVSSSVVSFGANGKQQRVRKDFPQRRLDYVFESPGPGSTFLISHRLLSLTQGTLSAGGGIAHRVEFHDSLMYALARAHGFTWHIDGVPSVRYRQHDDNVMGSNVGVSPAIRRLRLIARHWHREHTTVLTRAGLLVAAPETRAPLEMLLGLLTDFGLRNRWRLALRSGQLRRRPRDQWIIGILIAIGVW